MTSLPNARPLSFRTRISYGFGSVAFGVKDNGFSYFLQFFYAQVVGLPSASVGIAIMCALVIDAFIDPVVGQLSDNFRSRWGRRHPFMYASAIPVAVSYIMLWNPPSGLSETALVAYLFGGTVLIRTFITCYEIPSSALSAELTTDYNERTKLISYRFLFGWIGGLTMYMLATLVFIRPDGAGGGQLNAQGYQNYGLCAAGLMLVSILGSTFGTHRNIPALAKPQHAASSVKQLAHEMVSTLANRSFLFVLSAGLFNAMAIGLGFSITFYFISYFWQFSTSQIALLGISSVIAAVFAFGLAPRVTVQLDKRPVTMALIFGAMVVSIAPVLLRLAGLLPANGTPALFVMIFACNVLALTLSITGQILFNSMIADVVEDAELKTGRRQEGLFFAAMAFVSKAVTGAGILVTSLIVAGAGFTKGAVPGAVSADVVRALGWIYVPTTAVLYTIAVCLLFGYRITRKSHLETLRLLAERKTLQAGAAALNHGE